VYSQDPFTLSYTVIEDRAGVLHVSVALLWYCKAYTSEKVIHLLLKTDEGEITSGRWFASSLYVWIAGARRVCIHWRS
jgi:hypothetical protein